MNINCVSKAMVMAKRFFPIGLISFIIILSACEDPGILKADQNFSRSSIKTVYVDTFAVITSTTLIDSLPTSGNNLILVGNYKDSYIGNVSASSYFQIAYQSVFAPDQNSTFDSIGLVLPYSHYSYGDTTQSQMISVHQMTSLANGRLPLPYGIIGRK